MQAEQGQRQSVPLNAEGSHFSEPLLHQHSFDLLLFPRYLKRNFAAHVRVEVVSDACQSPHLMALLEKEGESRSMFALLHADEEGVALDSDAFFHAVHAAFATAAGSSRYLGFTRFGRPPYAPLFALAMLYGRYGRGLYLQGDVLPTPWPALQAGYSASC